MKSLLYICIPFLTCFPLFFTMLSAFHIKKHVSFFNHWHCIGIKNRIDFSKPYAINIGDLPLVLWKNELDNKLITTLNICKHMGSKLDNAKITNTGCLKCQYHGLEMSESDKFGETIEHQGKIFWAFQPFRKTPFHIPFFDNPEYENSFLEIDMDSSLTDSAYNTMDLRHPEYVHNSVVGFGNTVPPTNIKFYDYNSIRSRKSHDVTKVKQVGMSFDYASNPLMKKINNNIQRTKNFHMFVYPTFSWSRVSFEDKNLFIGVNLLPLEKQKTRWYITISHNYYTSDVGKNFMKMMASVILSQDFFQMRNQYNDNKLKQAVLFNHMFTNEEPIVELRKLFQDYKYPNMDACVELYNTYKSNIKK